MSRTVTVIPATVNPRLPKMNITKRRVAGYARVSTDSDEQFTSYEAQIDYYTNYIKSHAEWEYVNVYTDEGVSGCNTAHREGFRSMIADAMAGKIDLIVTKSVSRFARNTVDSLSTIRKLKENGTEVYFEKENIWTFDSKGELLLTIMSSLAQEESRSISENVTWGQRKRFSDGKVSLPYKQFLGYDKGEGKDAPPVINEEQAKVVRKIYSLFMEGKTPHTIAKYLTENRYPTPAGKELWQPTTIKSILSNEKYRGSARLQKKFTIDFLTKKTKKNEGEVPQYYIEQSHEAIIDPEEWDAVQAEIARRKEIGRSYTGVSPLCGKLVCEDCGSLYGRKLWHSNDRYRKAIWQCNHKFKNKCKTPNLSEEEIKDKFLNAYNRVIENKERVIASCTKAMKAITDSQSIDSEIEELERIIQNDVLMVEALVLHRDNDDMDSFLEQYNELVKKHDEHQAKLKKLTEQKDKLDVKRSKIDRYLNELKNKEELITEFDEKLWINVVDKVIVRKNKVLEFCFHDGSRVEVSDI